MLNFISKNSLLSQMVGQVSVIFCLMLRHHTALTPIAATLQLSYKDQLLSLGSCFAQNLGQRLQEQLYAVAINPFGVLYNPYSIANSLQLLLQDKLFEKDDLQFHGEAWHSLHHHSSFSGTNPNDTLENINMQLTEARQHLQNSQCLLLTFGTAWVYTWKETGQIVSNCHRFPASNFERRRLEVSEIVALMTTVVEQLRTQLGQLRVIFTVSPVRHLKDGLVENQVSKATLVLAVQQLVQQLDSVAYFPAYELLLDDLRDYRYYDKDLVHPNELAIDYVAQVFEQCHLKEEEKPLRQKAVQLQRAALHRPRQPHSTAHQKFLRQQLAHLEKLATQLPATPYKQLEEKFLAQVL